MISNFLRVSAVSLGALIMVANGALAVPPSGENAPSASPSPAIDNPLAPVGNDVPGERPTPQHTWVPGHWHWSEGAYAWEAGHWEIPPMPNLVWHAPEWQHQGNSYVLKEGYWDQPSVPTPA